MSLSQLSTTSVEVMGLSSLNLRSGRSWNTMRRPPSSTVQSDASAGWTRLSVSNAVSPS
jgi:hypothetical protein